MYCIVRTVLFTDFACYTTDFANIFDCFSEVSVVASYNNIILIRNKFYYGFWTFFYTFSASSTFFFVYYCYSVNYVNSIKIAYSDTVSVTEASLITGLISALNSRCCLTIPYSMIFMFFEARQSFPRHKT